MLIFNKIIYVGPSTHRLLKYQGRKVKRMKLHGLSNTTLCVSQRGLEYKEIQKMYDN